MKDTSVAAFTLSYLRGAATLASNMAELFAHHDRRKHVSEYAAEMWARSQAHAEASRRIYGLVAEQKRKMRTAAE